MEYGENKDWTWRCYIKIGQLHCKSCRLCLRAQN